MYGQWTLGMQNGALFAVPIPEEYESVGEELQRIVQQVVKRAEESGVSKRGKDVTPWLLSEVNKQSRGASLTSNIALIENTAHVAGQMAVAYTDLANERSGHIPKPLYTPFILPGTSFSSLERTPFNFDKPPDKTLPVKLLVIGSAAVDITARTNALLADELISNINTGSTSPGVISLSLGGVARNVAEAAHRTLSRSSTAKDAVLLVSSIGDDLFGRVLVEKSNHMGMRTDGLVTITNERTAVCNMILDSNGGLIGGTADMGIITTIDEKTILHELKKHEPDIVCMDANLSSEALSAIVRRCNETGIRTFYEPTSVVKSSAIQKAIVGWTNTNYSPITFASPNIMELTKMYSTFVVDSFDKLASVTRWTVLDRFAITSGYRTSLDQLARQNVSEADPSKGNLAFLTEDGVAQMAVNLLPFFQHLIIKCGDRGALLVMRVPRACKPEWEAEQSDSRRRLVVMHGSSEIVVLKHFPPPTLNTHDVLNVTGAGDTLIGTLAAAVVQDSTALSHPKKMDKVMEDSQNAAVMTLRSHHAVSPLLSSKNY